MIYNKLKWVSNEKELGSFLQIRDIKCQYFITKAKNEIDYTLTLVSDNINISFNSIQEAKYFSQIDFDQWYFSNN